MFKKRTFPCLIADYELSHIGVPIFIISMVLVLMFDVSDSMASEAEYISSEKPAPTTVKEAKDSIQKELEEEEKKERSRFPTLKQKFESLQPFFRDTELKINFRTYYRYKDLEEIPISEAWALGGYLAYRSGWYKDRIRIGAVGYTSQKL